MTGAPGYELRVPDSRRSLTSRTLALDVLEWGNVDAAQAVVVALHGYLDAAEFFAPLADELLARRPHVALIAHSAAGHGRSSWADGYAWSDHTADAIAVLDSVAARLNLRTRILVLGHSFGGIQALDVARRRRTQLAGIVNLDAVAPPRSSPDQSITDTIARSRAAHPGARATRVGRSIEELVTRRAEANPRIPSHLLRLLVECLAEHQTDGSWRWRLDPMLTGWVRPWEHSGVQQFTPLGTLAALRFPTLVVTGAADDHPAIRGPYPGDHAVSMVPRCRHVRLPDAGHYVHLERPDAVADALAEFIGELLDVDT